MIRIAIWGLLLLCLACREKTWPYGWAIEKTTMRTSGAGKNLAEFDMPRCSRVHILDDFRPKLDEFGTETGETLVEFRNLKGYLPRKAISPAAKNCLSPNDQKRLESPLEISDTNNYNEPEFAFDIDEMTHLEKLDVSHDLSNARLREIASLGHLKHLSVAVPGALPDLSPLAQMKSLESIMLTIPKNIPVPVGLNMLHQLKYLGLRKPDLCAVPVEIGEMKNLERLMFFEPACFTKLPAEFKNLNELREILIVGNISPQWLADLRQMFPRVYLNVRAN